MLQVVVESVENLADGDVGGRFCEHVPAVLARARLDDSRVAQAQGQLDEVVTRNGHLFRDLARRARLAFHCEVHHRANAVVDRRLQLHLPTPSSPVETHFALKRRRLQGRFNGTQKLGILVINHA